MLVKDIIKLACDFTGQEALGEKIAQSSLLETCEQEIVDKFVKCFNLVNNEIASEFVPIKKIEQFEVSNGKILLTQFSTKPYKILYIKNSLGRKMHFKQFEDYLVVFCKKAIVCYTTLPFALSINDQIDSFLPERVYAYGVAREFLFLQSRFDDADIFEERFKNALELICRSAPHAKMPSRRWL